MFRLFRFLRPYIEGSGWHTEYRCVNCDCIMSDSTRMDSNGRCRACGYKGPSACTIVDTREIAYRWKRIGFMKYEKDYALQK